MLSEEVFVLVTGCSSWWFCRYCLLPRNEVRDLSLTRTHTGTAAYGRWILNRVHSYDLISTVTHSWHLVWPRVPSSDVMVAVQSIPHKYDVQVVQ